MQKNLGERMVGVLESADARQRKGGGGAEPSLGDF